jgi:hypothetical protein
MAAEQNYCRDIEWLIDHPGDARFSKEYINELKEFIYSKTVNAVIPKNETSKEKNDVDNIVEEILANPQLQSQVPSEKTIPAICYPLMEHLPNPSIQFRDVKFLEEYIAEHVASDTTVNDSLKLADEVYQKILSKRLLKMYLFGVETKKDSQEHTIRKGVLVCGATQTLLTSNESCGLSQEIHGVFPAFTDRVVRWEQIVVIDSDLRLILRRPICTVKPIINKFTTDIIIKVQSFI